MIKSAPCYNKCLNCFRPINSCYCKYVEPLQVDCKFVFLMHPKEAYHQRTGTGRLAHLSLQDSEIFVGLDFSKDILFMQLLQNPEYYPVLMYPGEDALTAQSPALKDVTEKKKLLVILIDSTWFFAKKIIRLNPFLLQLPKISFATEYESQFTFKKQPAKGCLSTIETCYYFIKELSASNLITPCNPENLLSLFQKMVAFQLKSEEDRILRGEPPRNKRKSLFR